MSIILIYNVARLTSPGQVIVMHVFHPINDNKITSRPRHHHVHVTNPVKHIFRTKRTRIQPTTSRHEYNELLLQFLGP